MRALLLLVVASCGRISFDPRGDAMSSGGDARDATTMQDAADPSLLLDFPFDSSNTLLVDRARGHAASCIGTCPTVAPGHLGNGVMVSGNECIQIAPAADLQPSEFTVSLWASVTAGGELFSHPFNGMTSSNNSVEVFLQSSSAMWIVSGYTTYIQASGSFSQWTHVASSYDGQNVQLYLDGVLRASMPLAAMMYANDPLLIGCDRDNNADVAHVAGTIDEVRLYGRALSATEIAALAQ